MNSTFLILAIVASCSLRRFDEPSGDISAPMTDVYILPCRRITVAGDSLGGAVANLLGVYIAKKHGASLASKVKELTPT